MVYLIFSIMQVYFIEKDYTNVNYAVDANKSRRIQHK